MAVRRSLTFARMDEIMPEVDRLLAGHTLVGNWGLAQMCNHLSNSIQMSVEGFGIKLPWLLRATVGRIAKREIFSTGVMRSGIKLPKKFLPATGLDDRAEAEALRAAIGYYFTNPTPRAPHPMLGELSGPEWDRLHCIHSAHHLSFALQD